MNMAARFALVLAGAAVASAVYQQVSEAQDRRDYPAPGRVADIGGRRMHILVEGDGGPPVVIIPALGANVLEWVRVLRAASAETTVCTYDRSGLGFSDAPRGAVTIDAMADDLHALLKVAGIAPPYIIAGHSMGGIVARRFRSRYPAEVGGMLLIDSSHEDQVHRFSGGNWEWDTLRRAARRQTRILGVRRLGIRAGFTSGFDAASLDRETVPEYVGAAKAVSLTAKQRRAVVRELLLLARPQGQPQNLGDLPLTVLSAGNAKRRQWADWGTWCELQDELAALSTRSAHMYAVNADHFVHLDDPGVVVQAITDLVGQWRREQAG